MSPLRISPTILPLFIALGTLCPEGTSQPVTQGLKAFPISDPRPETEEPTPARPVPQTDEESLRKHVAAARALIGTLEIEGPHRGSVLRQVGAFLIAPDLAVTTANGLAGAHGATLRIGSETRTVQVAGLDILQDLAVLRMDTAFDVEAGLPLQKSHLVGNERAGIVGKTILMEDVAGICSLTGVTSLGPFLPVAHVQNLSQRGLAGSPLINDRGRVVGMLSSRVFEESGTRLVVSGSAIALLGRHDSLPINPGMVPAEPENQDSPDYAVWQKYELGIRQLLGGKTSKATETLADSESERGRMWYALALIKSQREVEALEVLDGILSHRPGSPTVHMLRGCAYDQLQKGREAASEFLKARTKSDKAQLPTMNLARAYTKINRGQDALSLLKSVLSEHPKYLPAILLRGKIMNKRLRFGEARDEFERILTLEPHHPGAWNGLGTMYLEQKMANRAADCFEKSLEIDPESLEAKIGICAVALAKKKWQKTIELSEPLLAENPRNVPLLQIAAKAYGRSKNLEKARDLFEEATFLEPENINAFMGLGVTYKEMLNYDRAILSYDEVLRLNPKHSGALFEAGFCHLMLGDRGEARARYKILLPIDPVSADRLFKLIYNK